MRSISFLSGSKSRWTRVETEKEASHFTHDLFTSGDYTGCAVQAANRRVLLEKTDLCERLGIELLVESYSTETLLFPIASLKDPELVEVFESLDKYPCLDHQALSDIEREMENECFNSFGRQDFKEYLRVNDLITDDQSDDITNEQLDYIYQEASSKTNYNIFEVESGTSGHFNFESFGGLYEKAIEMLRPIINKQLSRNDFINKHESEF
jgi:hypothetical protein